MIILKVHLKENFLIHYTDKLCVTAQVHVLELWNNNIKQLENNMLKSDTSFGEIGRISLKK